MVQAQVMGHDDRHPYPYQSHDDMELVPGMVKGLELALEQELELERAQVLELELGMDLGNHDHDRQNR